MATNNYTKKTASLKASKIDVRKLNVKGKDVVTHIGQKVNTCKDTRQTITENDKWGTYVEVTDKGEVIFHDDSINLNGLAYKGHNFTKIEDNKAYVDDTFFGNIQTEKIKSAYDAFIDNTQLTTFSGNLDSLINGIYMFNGCSSLSNFDCKSMKSLKCASCMFLSVGVQQGRLGGGITTFNCQLPNLEYADTMFCQACNMTTFSSKLPKLKDSTYMFENCFALENFEPTILPQVLTSKGMFSACEVLQKCTLEMPKVTNTQQMFSYCPVISDVDIKMPQVVTANGMFISCENLEQFVGDLSSLKDGINMFQDCVKLKKFRGRLDNLICGYGMFSNTKLDVDSFMYIADSINDLAGKGLVEWDERTSLWYPVIRDTEDQNYIGRITYHQTGYDNSNPYNCFVEKITEVQSRRAGVIVLYYDAEQYPDGSEGHTQILEYCQEICDKGWKIGLNSTTNSSFVPSTNQTSIDGEENVQPISYWFKPIEADKEHGTYVNANGEYFDIMGGRYIFGDDISTYGQFISLEQAEQAMGLTKVVREKTTKTKTRNFNK